MRSLSDIGASPILLLHCQLSVAEAAELMAKARTDAGLVEGVDGRLVGILTDSDVSIKVAASGRSLRKTLVQDVMTKNPLCVRKTERADKALALMAEKRARHLPLLDAKGALSGMLDIARVLYDAITELEKTRGSSQYFPAMNRLLNGDDERIPTLAEALASRPFATARPRDPIAVAFRGLRTTRRSVLVLDEHGKLVGILSKSDVAKRALRTALSVDAALGDEAELKALHRLAVRDCMTPRPDVVRSSATVLDALHKMHDGKYSNLPVVDHNDVPVGVVDVLDLLSESSGRRASQTKAPSLLENFFSVNRSSSGVRGAASGSLDDDHHDDFPDHHHGLGDLLEDDDVDAPVVVHRSVTFDPAITTRDNGDDVVFAEAATSDDDDDGGGGGKKNSHYEPPAQQLPTLPTTRASAVLCAISPATLKHSKPARLDAVVVSGSIDVLDSSAARGGKVLVTLPSDASFADLQAKLKVALPAEEGYHLEYSDALCTRLKIVDDASLHAAAHLGQARAAGTDDHVRLTLVHSASAPSGRLGLSLVAIAAIAALIALRR